MVVLLVRQLYPDTPSLLLPFAFAVFMAAGVAPFVTSNPMNTVVAGVAEIDFNEYAARMLPVALAGSVVTFFVLRLALRRRAAPAPRPPRSSRAHEAVDARRSSRRSCSCWPCSAAYPVFALADLQVFAVAADRRGDRPGARAGATSAGRPPEVLRTAVAWEILVFLVGMFLLAQGLQNVGVVERLTDLYEDTGPG